MDTDTTEPPSSFVPGWVLRQMKNREQTFQEDGLITLLEMRATQLGQVAVRGAWIDIDGPLMDTKEMVSLLRMSLPAPAGISNLKIDLGTNGRMVATFGF